MRRERVEGKEGEGKGERESTGRNGKNVLPHIKPDVAACAFHRRKRFVL